VLSALANCTSRVPDSSCTRSMKFGETEGKDGNKKAKMVNRQRNF
jgi:hypothetical protein